MTNSVVKREVLEGGVTRLQVEGCTFTYERHGRDRILITIIGSDEGHFGSATIDEILLAIGREGPLELFVDASKATAVSVAVSDMWTRFFARNRNELKRVHILTGSEYVHLAISISQHLSRTGDLIRIHSDPVRFTELMRGDRSALPEG
jgi:hypothetical protein